MAFKRYGLGTNRMGIKPSDIVDRKGYSATSRIAEHTVERFSNEWSSKVVDPVRNRPAPTVVQQAANQVYNELSNDARVLGGLQKANLLDRLTSMKDEISRARTYGDLDDLRKKFNKLAHDYYDKSSGDQYDAAFGKQMLDRGGNAIREAMYKAFENEYPGQVHETWIRNFMTHYGDAIEIRNLAERAQIPMSEAASEAVATKPPMKFPVRLRENIHMGGGGASTYVHLGENLLPTPTAPQLKTFNARIAKAIEGANKRTTPVRQYLPIRLVPRP